MECRINIIVMLFVFIRLVNIGILVNFKCWCRSEGVGSFIYC